MTHYEYNIHYFWYFGGHFIGEESKLGMGGYNYSFPSGRKQFFIKNYGTNGFRRFRLIRETDKFYEFISEDNYFCIVIKE